jgi:hypothetical protein
VRPTPVLLATSRVCSTGAARVPMRAVPGGVGYPRRYECTRWALEVLKGYSRRIACSCLCVFGCGGACSEASGAIATPASRPMRLCDAFSTKRLRLSHARASSVSTAVSAPRGSVRSQLRTSLWQAHQRQAARQGMASNGGTHASEWSVSGWNINTLSVRCFSHDSSSSLTAGRAARNSGPSSAEEYIVVHGYLELPMECSHSRRGHTSARVHSTDGEAKSASGRGQTAGSSRAFQSV